MNRLLLLKLLCTSLFDKFGLCLLSPRSIRIGKYVKWPYRGSVWLRVPKTPRQSTLHQLVSPLPQYALPYWSLAFLSKTKRCSLAPSNIQHIHAKSNHLWILLFFLALLVRSGFPKMDLSWTLYLFPLSHRSLRIVFSGFVFLDLMLDIALLLFSILIRSGTNHKMTLWLLCLSPAYPCITSCIPTTQENGSPEPKVQSLAHAK